MKSVRLHGEQPIICNSFEESEQDDCSHLEFVESDQAMHEDDLRFNEFVDFREQWVKLVQENETNGKGEEEIVCEVDDGGEMEDSMTLGTMIVRMIRRRAKILMKTQTWTIHNLRLICCSITAKHLQRAVTHYPLHVRIEASDA